jgi:hypothetical protein
MYPHHSLMLMERRPARCGYRYDARHDVGRRSMSISEWCGYLARYPNISAIC